MKSNKLLQKVIGGTLVLLFAVGCSVLATPTPTPTPVPPTATSTQIPPTVTPTATKTPTVVPTATFTEMPTPTVTRTPTPPKGNLVQGSVYGIKMISVQKTDSYLGSDRFVHADPGQVFLVLEVEFNKNGVPLLDLDNDYTLELSVIDSMGRLYRRQYASLTGTLDSTLTYFTPTHHTVVFSVPRTATGFKLKYRDLPLVDLGM